MVTISVEDAQAKLAELIRSLAPGDEVIITANDHPVAKLTSTPSESAAMPRQPGTLRGTVLHYASDFDAPLDEFQEYMP
jgi:prevent-host-death family protein